MSWSFSRRTGRQKPAIQLKQEAAVVLALGGGYQAYFKQDRDGAIRDPAEMDVMADVAEFCRRRQAFCHRSVAVPQIALLYSAAGHYRVSPRLFHWADSPGITVLRQALTEILKDHYGVQILSEHHLRGRMSRFPAIIVPDWGYLDPPFRRELASYAGAGGRLLLIGAGPAKLFEHELDGLPANPTWIIAIDSVDEAFPQALERLISKPIVRVTGSNSVDVSPRILNGSLSIHLVNTSGPHANAPDEGIQDIPSVGPLTVTIRLHEAPKSILHQPENKQLPVTWSEGYATVMLPKLDLYSILVIEP